MYVFFKHLLKLDLSWWLKYLSLSWVCLLTDQFGIVNRKTQMSCVAIQGDSINEIEGVIIAVVFAI